MEKALNRVLKGALTLNIQKCGIAEKNEQVGMSVLKQQDSQSTNSWVVQLKKHPSQ